MTEHKSTPSFRPGLELSRRFFADAVEPLVAERFPRLAYAAALIGPGSEVLGFDTETSTDHHWGPRVMLFLSDADVGNIGPVIDDLLSQRLPVSFLGYSTNFGPPDEIGVRLLQPIEAGPVAHRVEISSVGAWFQRYLSWDSRHAPSVVDWLSFPEHRLRSATAGEVFRDDQGELTRVRSTLTWYPDDVWLFLLAAQWNRIAEEEAFMARCGEIGDDVGSTLVSARLVKDLMRLCFLMERRYPPYAKWFGTGFRQLQCAHRLEQPLLDALRLPTWQERQSALSEALEFVAERHNELGITPYLDPRVRPFHGRPYLVIAADRFADAIESQISDPNVLRLSRRHGSLNQLLDSTDKLESADLRERLRRLYD